MKLTKTKLKQIIKEEFDAANRFPRPHMRSAAKWYEETGRKLFNQQKSRFPALIEKLQIDDDTLQQIAVEAVIAEKAAPGLSTIDTNLFFTHVNKFLQEG